MLGSNSFRLLLPCLMLFALCAADGMITYSGPQNVEVGSNFSITCNASNLRPLEWTRDNKKLEGSEYSMVMLADNEMYKVAMLVVRHANINHSGQYRCYSFSETYHNLIVHYAADKITYSGPRYVDVGSSSFNITCNASTVGPIEWTRDFKKLKDPEYSMYILAENETYKVAMLVFRGSVNEAHTGKYRCYRFTEAYHNLTVSNGSSRGANETIKELNLNKDTTITCDDIPEYQSITWTKDGAPLDLSDKTKYTDNVTAIIIHSSKDSDGGVYVCLVNGGQLAIRTTIAMSKARVENLPDSINLVEDDPLNLTCTVFGYPLPNVTWYKDDIPIKELNNTRIRLVPNYANVSDATILIDHLKYEDRANYKCVAINYLSTEGAANDTILVRVKDKLAALWPFLGIVAEVAILCTIILVYEKRRAKQEYDESDTDQNNESKPVTDQKDKEVRQRK